MIGNSAPASPRLRSFLPACAATLAITWFFILTWLEEAAILMRSVFADLDGVLRLVCGGRPAGSKGGSNEARPSR